MLSGAWAFSCRLTFNTLAYAVALQVKPNVDKPKSEVLAELALPVVPQIVALKREEYLLVKFWDRSSWQEYYRKERGVSSSRQRGRTAASKGINVAMRYIKNETGDAVDGCQASEIWRIAYRIFQQLEAHGVAPKSWGVAILQRNGHTNSRDASLRWALEGGISCYPCISVVALQPCEEKCEYQVGI